MSMYYLCLVLECFCIQEGATAVFYAIRQRPAALVQVLLSELQCNPKVLPVVSH